MQGRQSSNWHECTPERHSDMDMQDAVQSRQSSRDLKKNHKAEEGCGRTAKAAIGMSTHDNHAQVLHATDNGNLTAAMCNREPLRYPPLRGQPGVPAQARNKTKQ